MTMAASTRRSEADLKHIFSLERAMAYAKSTGERDTDFSNLKQFAKGRVGNAITLNNLASFLQDQGKYDEALPLFQRALAIKEKHLGAVRHHIF